MKREEQEGEKVWILTSWMDKAVYVCGVFFLVTLVVSQILGFASVL